MKLVFYSSSTNHFDGNTFHYWDCPSNAEYLADFCARHKDLELLVVTERPGLFLVDLDGNELGGCCHNVRYELLSDADVQDFVAVIRAFSPDLVISAGFYLAPYDWLSLKDALIGEELDKLGIHVIFQPGSAAELCFDKWRTHAFLEGNGFNVPGAVYVHHELFWAERNNAELKENAYKEYVFSRIMRLRPPLVIKPTTGLSSCGMEVVKSHAAAVNFLQSKKCSSDRLVEEYISGIQLGTELYGSGQEASCRIFPPFMFSVNQYGITSPKQSVKAGPVTGAAFCTEELFPELRRLARLLDLRGAAQVDIVFSEEQRKWFIIEINPRLSGLTRTLCASSGKSVYDLLFEAADRKACKKTELLPTLSLKFPILPETELKTLSALPFVRHTSQTVNDAARQRRECGYCEAVLCAPDFFQLKDSLSLLRQKLPDCIEKDFYSTAIRMLDSLIRLSAGETSGRGAF